MCVQWRFFKWAVSQGIIKKGEHPKLENKIYLIYHLLAASMWNGETFP